MDMRRLVGRNVKAARLKAQLSQEQLAERSGFTQQYLSGLERGQRNPTIVSLYEIAQALGTTPIELLREQPGLCQYPG
jgi:transcriptional regulator with XRE-family HTH domain